MAESFFKKLKRGMGIEEPEKEKKEKPDKKTAWQKKEIETKLPEVKLEKSELERKKMKKEKVPPEKIEKEKPSPASAETLTKKTTLEAKPSLETSLAKDKWLEAQGELAIDVYQTETDLVIQSAIAGVNPEFLDIFLERDVITIKGTREKPVEEEGDYFTQECYWGPFSREVILPAEVDPDQAQATMKDGILTIRIPKILREKKRKIKVKV